MARGGDGPVPTPLPVSPTPYITPATLRVAPTGITWTTIPPGNNVSPEARLAEQSNICARSTALVDQACRQPLRATTDILMLYGPGKGVGIHGPGPATLILKRWPVLEIVSVQVAPNRLPYTWTPVPAGEYWIKDPVSGMYGSAVPLAAGEGSQAIYVSRQYVNERSCRDDGIAIQVAYRNGWPHCGLTALALDGATEIAVDDCTGWAVTSPLTGSTGATGTVCDSGAQEVIQVTAASAASGPGTLTLASPLQYGHGAGVIVSTLLQNVEWAAIMFAVSQALTRGATSTTVHQIPGGPGGRAPGPGDWDKCARAMLSDYARII